MSSRTYRRTMRLITTLSLGAATLAFAGLCADAVMVGPNLPALVFC